MVTSIKWDKEADVVVVGFGGAGATAAIEAHDNKAKVILLEKMPEPGGDTLISGGMVWGSNTPVQKQKGVEDSPEEALKLLRALSEGFADEEILKVCVNASGENIDWLMKLGVNFPPELLIILGLDESPQYAAITPPKTRVHINQSFTGEGIMTPLQKAIGARGIEVLLNTPGKELISNPATREVLGVKTEKLSIKARKAVVLASGGFCRNEEMVNSYLSYYAGKLWPATAMGLTGDGIKMGQALGAELRNMGLVSLFVTGVPHGPPSFTEPVVMAAPLITAAAYAPCVVVNKKAVRFVDDYLFYASLCLKLIAEVEDQTCFCIFDDKTRKMGGNLILLPALSEDLSKEIELGVVKTAPTLRELAGKLGLDPETLEDTVFTFNENARKGVDPDFGRTQHLVPVDAPPFYAMQYKPTFMATSGGLKINSRFQVVDVLGRVIPRLYAAGETAAGPIGKTYSSGNFLMYATTSGRLAARSAAAEKPW